jgi:integrase
VKDPHGYRSGNHGEKMRLTDLQVKNAKSNNGKPRKLFDSEGLFLYISGKNKKKWRGRSFLGGKEKVITLGSYPAMSLQTARMKNAEARALLAEGIDPIIERQKEKLIRESEFESTTFQYIALEWLDSRKHIWSEIHYTKMKALLERKLFPHIGKLQITEISHPVMLGALRLMEKQGKYDTAKRAKQLAGRIFSYARSQGIKVDRITDDLTEALTVHKKQHMAAITDPKATGRLMVAIDAYVGTPVVCSALKLAPLLFVRPGELRSMEWSEIDWEAKLWLIPAEKTKMRESHIVPLSRQSLEILRFIQRFTGEGRYVFSNPRSSQRPMSENAVLVALRTMGYEKHVMTGHGFRAMARTLIAERLKISSEWIELQLAHSVRDPLGRAYNRTTFLDERVEMMQKWADYLDELRDQAGAK